MAANSIPLNLEILYGIQTGLKKVGEHFIYFFIQAHAKSYWLASSSIRYKKRTSRYWSNSPIGYDAILKEYEKGHIFYSRVLIFDVNSKCNLALIKISDTDYQAKQKKEKHYLSSEKIQVLWLVSLCFK